MGAEVAGFRFPASFAEVVFMKNFAPELAKKLYERPPERPERHVFSEPGEEQRKLAQNMSPIFRDLF